MSLLEISNLSLSIDQKIILSKLNFNIDSGKITGIVGNSGSGKSILSKQIIRINNSNKISASGKILFNGLDLNKLSEKQLEKIRGNEISMVFQEPMTSLNPIHHIKKQIKEAILLHEKISNNDLEARVKELLIEVGLKKLINRGKIFPHQLSGGERQRVVIAIALACLPKLIIADEPTTSLDKTNSANIIKLLKKISHDHNIAIIFITHDLALIRKTADKIIVMNNGQIIEEDKTEIIFNNPQKQYTKDLLATSLPLFKKSKFANNEIILKTENLSLNYKKRHFFKKHITSIFENVNFEIKKGETVGLIGESGSGKSSLAEAILKLKSSSGDIIINDTNITKLKGEKLRLFRQNMQIIFQDPFATLNPRHRIIDILYEVINAHNLSTDIKTIKQFIKDVNLKEDILDKFPNEFSGGERQRIVILRALCLFPKLIILDEPTSSLDATTQKNVINLLLKLQNKYQLSYLLITHDENVLTSMSNRIYQLKNTKLQEIEN